MDLYCLYYKESVDELCARIDTNLLLSHIVYNIDYGNDIYLVHAIYYTAKELSIFRKNDIRDKIWAKISPRLNISDDNGIGRAYKDYEYGFRQLFDYCWKVRFSLTETKDIKETRELSKVVYATRSFKNKLYNSNLAVLFFAGLFVALQVCINNSFWNLKFIETHEVVIVIGILFTSIFIGAGAGNIYSIPILGIIATVVLLIGDLCGDYSSECTVALVKRDLIWAATYLLWFPMIHLNYDRLKDQNYV